VTFIKKKTRINKRHGKIFSKTISHTAPQTRYKNHQNKILTQFNFLGNKFKHKLLKEICQYWNCSYCTLLVLVVWIIYIRYLVGFFIKAFATWKVICCLDWLLIEMSVWRPVYNNNTVWFYIAPHSTALFWGALHEKWVD